MKINDAIFGAILLLLGIAVVVAVQAFPRIPGQNVGPGLFPGLIGTGLAACGALLVIGGIRQRAGARWVEPMPWMRSPRHVAAFAVTVATVVAYVLLADVVGFLIIAPLLLFAMFVAYGVRPGPAPVGAVVATAGGWGPVYQLLRGARPGGVRQRFAF